MQIQEFIAQATKRLSNSGIESARLDALVLLSDTLKLEKSQILAHPERIINNEHLQQLNCLLDLRTKRRPLAYIRKQQEFYGRIFKVTPDTLIPRPETEEIIEQLRTITLPKNPNILDVGTGSGAIAITAALEFPTARINACDISDSAIKIAKQNSAALDGKITFFNSDLLNKAQKYDIIIANLPYVDKTWSMSPELKYEPDLALYASNNGLDLIYKLLNQAPNHLNEKGYVILEADPRQHDAIINFARNYNFQLITQSNFILVLRAK